MGEAQSEALDGHVAACTECRQFESELQECATLLDGMPIPQPSAGFTRHVISRLASQNRDMLDRRDILRPIPIGLAAASFLFGTMLSIWAEHSQSSNGMSQSDNLTLVESDLLDFGTVDDLNQLVATVLPEMGE